MPRTPERQVRRPMRGSDGMFHVKPLPLRTGAGTRRAWAAGLVLAGLCGLVHAAGAINKCTDFRGRATFSDKTCPPDQTMVVVQEAPPVQVPASAPAASASAAASAPAAASASAPRTAGSAPRAAAPPPPAPPKSAGPAAPRAASDCQRRRKFIEDTRQGLGAKDAQFRRAFAAAEKEVALECSQ